MSTVGTPSPALKPAEEDALAITTVTPEVGTRRKLGGITGSIGTNSTTKKKRVKEFSGGMKRRLSVACSLMGNPRLVYMDEPSTGLDPASRRKLWELIVEGKKGRAIILTTHSMEEADVLCDRIGVMCRGELTEVRPVEDWSEPEIIRAALGQAETGEAAA